MDSTTLHFVSDWLKFLILCLMCTSQTLAGTKESELLQTVLETIREQDSSLHSIRVTYTYSNKLVGNAADVSKYTPIACIGTDRQVFAVKGSKRYFSYDRTGDLADRAAELQSVAQLAGVPGATPINTTANTIVAFNGSTLRRRDPGGQMGALLDLKEVDTKGHFNSMYLGLSCRVAPGGKGGKALPEGRLSDGIEAGLCTLRAGREDVAGHSCISIDWKRKPRMRIWCDPALGYAIRKKEIYQGDGDVLTWQINMDRFEEVTPGFWLPTHALANRFAGAKAPTELQGEVLVVYEYDVQTIEANNIPDEFFDLKFPAGLEVADCRADDATRPAKILIAGNDGSLNERRPFTTQLHRSNNRYFTRFILPANILVFIVLGVTLWRRRQRGQ
ncbi:MAG: hypothetical protein JSS49_29295 [Planctomycetes bacterium]|nr:hypothetical protein [Planctomycetota bacterium]